VRKLYVSFGLGPLKGGCGPMSVFMKYEVETLDLNNRKCKNCVVAAKILKNATYYFLLIMDSPDMIGYRSVTYILDSSSSN